MAIRVVRLGTARWRDEGLRIGTVRRPPRGVPKSDYAARNYYDVWLPEIAPSDGLVRIGLQAADPKAWHVFVKRYRTEMQKPGPSRILDLLAALSQATSFSVGCYCEDEDRCHRSILRELLVARGAKVQMDRTPTPPRA